jgi:hypothetical protein
MGFVFGEWRMGASSGRGSIPTVYSLSHFLRTADFWLREVGIGFVFGEWWTGASSGRGSMPAG